jgi:hypothetical protein
MKQILLILALTFFVGLQTEACTCGVEAIEKVRQRSIEQSDLIFIARVIFTDTINGYFILRISKVFKGIVKGKIEASIAVDSMGNLSSCGFWPSPYWGKKFIIYANRVEGSKRIYIDQCSASRSTTHPNVHLSYQANRLNDRKQLKQAKADLKEEIAILESFITH